MIVLVVFPGALKSNLIDGANLQQSANRESVCTRPLKFLPDGTHRPKQLEEWRTAADAGVGALLLAGIVRMREGRLGAVQSRHGIFLVRELLPPFLIGFADFGLFFLRAHSTLSKLPALS